MDGRLNSKMRSFTIFYSKPVTGLPNFVYKGTIIIMKKIINLTVLLALLMLVANQASAQSKMTEEQKKEAKENYQAYKEKLNLTDEQSKKVDAINAEWLTGLADLKKSNASKMAKYKK